MSRRASKANGTGTLGGRLFALATVIATTGAIGVARAQEHGDVRSGLVLARHACATCHAVERGNTRSPHGDAPAFATIAAVPGMSPLALTAALRTSHETMPNLVLAPDDLANVVAYILTLRAP